MDEQVISNGCPMLRKKTYSIEEVLSLVPEYDGIVKRRKIDFDGDEIYIDSLRYFTFKKDNCTCTSCGLKGSFFAKEKFPNDKRYHLNLYAIDKDGNEVPDYPLPPNVENFKFAIHDDLGTASDHANREYILDRIGSDEN